MMPRIILRLIQHLRENWYVKHLYFGESYWLLEWWVCSRN